MNLELRSLISADGRLRLWLDYVPVPSPGPGEVLVRMAAAPLNPSDILLMLGPADLDTLTVSGTADRPIIQADVPPGRLAAIRGRLDRPLAVGNEGAGDVVAAGEGASDLIGRVVALRATTGSYARYQCVRAADCLVLPEGLTSRDGAAAFINPLTAIGMTEAMRQEGHRALVHTAAASNLGRMLNRLTLADGIPLVNIVRSAEQEALLRREGARHVINSTHPDFRALLRDAVAQTGATLAFDAIGGGTMAATILSVMEEVESTRLVTYSRYGSPVHKQVYIYGVLDPSPRILDGQFGMAWGVGGWLMTWFYEKLAPDVAARLRSRVASELTSTFASQFTTEIGLAEALDPAMIRRYARRATGEKFLINPRREGL